MAYRVGLSLPRVVVRGVALTLTMPVYNDAGTEQTFTSGTLTVRLGSKILLDEVAVTSNGPPASYSLLAATTSSEDLSDEWHETWTDTVLGSFTHSGYLVRTGYHSRVTDAALQQLHPELLNLLPPGETTAEKFRVKASEQVQRDLIKKGRRPWLVFDQWALFDAEVLFALHLWARDAAMRSTGQAMYAQLAREYLDRYNSEWNAISFRYDEDEDGAISENQQQTAAPAGITLTAGRPRSAGAW